MATDPFVLLAAAPKDRRSDQSLLIAAIPVVWSCGIARLICPRCGFDYVHPVSIDCLPAGDTGGEIHIEKAGVFWNPTQDPIGRGVIIKLTFVCESHHQFAYQFVFHKGQTEVVRCDYPDPKDVETIWRD